MTKAPYARQPSTPTVVVGQVLRQFTHSCLLLRRVMSWAFGLKAKPGTDKPKNVSNETGQEGGEKSIKKLTGYHELAKALLDRAINIDTSGNRPEAVKQYHQAINVLYEGLSVQAPAAWLSGSNVNKMRSDLNSWLQGAADRLRDLESPTPSTSAPGKTIATRQNGNLPPTRTNTNRQQPAQQLQQQPAARRDRQTTVIARQRSGPEKRKENAEEDKLREAVLSEVLDIKPTESWQDIAGLGGAKQALQEMVILPTQRADLFQGLRAPARGLLLYGPPGNGKTMLAKALAHEARATFFNISAATLTSKWHGEGEKLVRMLFKVAAENQPAIIFIDEIDSILTERSSGEHDASRRLKTEFMIQCDGISSGSERIIVIGATNRPQELDDAIRRRLVKKIYIPLPEASARRTLISAMLKDQAVQLNAGQMDSLVRATEGYSGSDLRALCQEAAMIPIRELGPAISTIAADKIRPIQSKDFALALRQSKPSVNRSQLASFEQWTQEFGTTG